MKTIDKYLKFKEMYKDHVIIIKSGNFYYTFLDDTPCYELSIWLSNKRKQNWLSPKC